MIDMQQLRHSTGSKDGLSLDVAIIGAGVSGLYAGYRLLHGDYSDPAKTPESVHVLEMGDRVGGRLESIRLPGSRVIGELGGMRYLTSQKIVTRLIEQVLEIPRRKFPLGDRSNHFVYLRGQRFRADAWRTAQANNERFETPYKLREEFEGFGPDQLLNRVVYTVLRSDPWVQEHYSSRISNPSPYTFTFELDRLAWNEIKPRLRYNFSGSPYNGMRVNDMGFWNLIKDQVGNEGYEFIANGGGYFSNTINWNAAEAFPYMIGDFSADEVEFMSLDQGYDQLAAGLAVKFLEDERSQLWTGNSLREVSRCDTGDRKYQLTIFNAAQQESWTVRADNVVLAMPRRSLELLDNVELFPDANHTADFQQNVDSVIKEPSFKLLMGFEYPWWRREFGATAGESITDLPMRQCYYFGVDDENEHSLFLSSYNDMRTVPFWNVLAESGDTTFPSRATTLASEQDLLPWRANQAPRVMVDEALNQVREVHGLNAAQIPEPYVTYYKDWSADPYGGGYHAWRAGADVAATMRYMRHPFEGESIFICGEAYSDQQGWVEGAFCVAEHMLQESFGLDWPGDWLETDYYLGW